MRVRQIVCIAGLLLSCWTAGAMGQTTGTGAGTGAGTGSPLAPPAGGTALLQNTPQSIGTGSNEHGKVELVEVNAPQFAQALRFTTTKPGEDYALNRTVPIEHQFRKGEVVLLEFWARTISTRRETGQGLAQVHLSENGPPWRQEAGRFVTFTDQWQQFFSPGVISRDYPPGRLALKIFVGNVEQVIEVGGVRVLSYGVGYDAAKLPRTRSMYEGIEADAPWRARAQQRIEEVRTAPISIEVIGRDGKPVAGAQVKAELLRHAFDFGSSISAFTIARGKESRDEMFQRKFKELFNSGTFENHLKWEPWAGFWGDYHAPDVTMDALRWFRDNDLAFRGHVMVWPSYRFLPPFMKDVKDPEAIRKLVMARIDDVAMTTAGLVQEWDVVNEPYHNHDLMDIAGRQIMVEWFKRARQRLPGVRLALNDYSLLTPLTDTPKQAAFLETIQYLMDNGAQVDVMGLQGHFGGTVPGPERMYSILDRFSKLGAEIRVTEYDINTDEPELKHDFTRDLLITLYSHPAVIGWQTWGIGNIVKDDGSFTPEGRAFNELVHHQWKTRVGATTDAGGAVQSRGHLGRYRVEVTQGARGTVTYLDLRKDSPTLVVTLP